MHTNTGGRAHFSVGEIVRVIEPDGKVTGLDYIIDQDRSDRRGQLQIIHKESGRIKKTHHRRILSSDYHDGMAVVLESNNRFFALCPKCGDSEEITNGDSWVCNNCGEFELHWLSNRPDTIKQVKARNLKAPSMTTRAPTIDLESIARLPNIELWTKKNIQFDHERIDVRAHVLIFDDGQQLRKYCFNTYNGTLGKKQKKLYVEEFIANTSVESKKLWYCIDNKDKAVCKLIKEGYERA